MIRAKLPHLACMAIAPTCHVGPSSGSIIDHILVSPSLFDQIFDFQVTKHIAVKDHSEVLIQLRVPHPTQIRRNLRRPDQINDLVFLSLTTFSFVYQLLNLLSKLSNTETLTPLIRSFFLPSRCYIGICSCKVV